VVVGLDRCGHHYYICMGRKRKTGTFRHDNHLTNAAVQLLDTTGAVAFVPLGCLLGPLLLWGSAVTGCLLYDSAPSGLPWPPTGAACG
jgi:hypothetical protein